MKINLIPKLNKQTDIKPIYALRYNTTLTYLNLGENNITDIEPICEALKYNTTLTELDLSDNEFGRDYVRDYVSDNIRFLSNILKVNTTLITLNLSQSCLDSYDLKLIFNALCYNTTLTNLKLLGCRKSDDSYIEFFSKMLLNNTTLNTLYINGCTVSEYEIIERLLKYNTSLTDLKIYG